MGKGSQKMRGAVLVAIAAAIGNMLQGWDNATIAGKRIEDHLFPIYMYM